MDELIMKIIEIDDKAREVISDAKKANVGLEASIREKTKELEADIERRAHERKEAIRNIEESDTEERIAAVNKELDEKIASLDDKYKSNREAWIGSIVENITGRQMN